jgi:hypothetical protein
MIRRLKRSEIDIEKWNRCVRESASGEVFYLHWYLDTCAETWEGLVQNDYDAVMPLAPKNRFGVSYLYQPFFTRHFGVISKVETDPIQQQCFIDAVPVSYRYWDFCLLPNHAVAPDAIISEKKYQLLALNREYAELRSRYHENNKRNLTKAAKAGLTLEEGLQTELLVEAFRREREKAIEEFGSEHYHLLLKLMNEAIRNTDTLSIAVLDSQRKLLAGAFFILDCRRLLYLKGFSSQAGRKCGAMHYLFDKMIRRFSCQPLVLDFGGSSIPSIARFFHGFGSSDCLYLRHQVNRLPHLLRWLKKT